jgi:hypothetical protein
LGDVEKILLDVVTQVDEPHLTWFDGNRSRLDLRKIENVVDEGEEVGARGVNRRRKADLLRREVSLHVFRKHPRQDE